MRGISRRRTRTYAKHPSRRGILLSRPDAPPPTRHGGFWWLSARDGSVRYSTPFGKRRRQDARHPTALPQNTTAKRQRHPCSYTHLSSCRRDARFLRALVCARLPTADETSVHAAKKQKDRHDDRPSTARCETFPLKLRSTARRILLRSTPRNLRHVLAQRFLENVPAPGVAMPHSNMIDNS